MVNYINNMFIGEILPNITVGGCISIYENIFPNTDQTISAIENECINSDSVVKFTKATTIGAGIYQTYRTNYALDITYAAKSENQICQDIHNQTYTLLLATTIPYLNKMNAHEQLYHEHYQMLKYPINTEYKEHYDGGTGSGRCISAIIYLNDDYEGGEIEFPRFDIKVKPRAGMLILFPSNYAYAHIAHPVTKGTKYAIVTWIHDRPIE